MCCRSFLLMLLTISMTTSVIIADKLLKPEIAQANAESCVADKDYMRRNHMDLLQHDRDKTVHEGDRNIKYSLKQCVTCHAVEGASGETLSASDAKHFCRTCHDYAAVKIDCFQCHASKPEAKVTVGKKQ